MDFQWIANRFKEPGYLVCFGAMASLLLDIAVLLKQDALVGQYPKWRSASKDNASRGA